MDCSGIRQYHPRRMFFITYLTNYSFGGKRSKDDNVSCFGECFKHFIETWQSKIRQLSAMGNWQLDYPCRCIFVAASQMTVCSDIFTVDWWIDQCPMNLFLSASKKPSFKPIPHMENKLDWDLTNCLHLITYNKHKIPTLRMRFWEPVLVKVYCVLAISSAWLSVLR